ncbi:MAG TPA: hypothetical protein PLT50_02355 [bacterium]|nr:hypothetical protein [bacterium]
MASKASSKDKRLAEITLNRYKKARDLCQPRFDAVEVNRNLYKGAINIDDTYEWDYSLVDQQVFPLIRNYISRSNPSMTKVRLEARKPEDFEKRQINQDFVNWEINELSLTTLLTRAFFSNYITGKAYFKSGWKHEPRVVVEQDGYSFEMRPLINRADLKFVRFNNILIPNRNIPVLEEQPYILELMQMRVGDMIKDNETYGYEYWDERFIKKLRKAGVTSKELDYEAEFVQDSDTKDEMAFRAATFPAVCMHTLEGDVIYVPIVDGSDEIINKNRENPYWHGHYPYIDMTAFPEDDEFFSMSVIDAVGDTQIASTEVLNQTLTNIRSINNNMWIAGVSAASTPDYMFKQRPSGIIRVPGDPSLVQPIRPIDSTNSMLRMSQELSSKFERTGGISSLYSSGAASMKAVNQTARGAQIIDQNIETNVRMIVDLFGEQVLKKLGDHFLSLNAQYVTEKQTFAVTGKKGVRELVSISPDQVTANFDVYTMPEQMIKQTPASRQASLQNLISVINTEAMRGGVMVDIAPLMEALIDSYPDMENVEDIVVSVDEKAGRDIAMLERGQMPEIKIRDQHQELVMAATIHFEENQMNYPPEVQQLFQDYIEKHFSYIQAEQEIRAMAQPQMPQAQSPEALMQAVGAEETGMLPENLGTGEPQTYNLGQIAGQ